MAIPYTPPSALERAELARQVTENPIFKQAVRKMREDFFRYFVESTPDQSNVRDLAYNNTRFLEVFVTTLEGYIQSAAVVGEEVELP